MECSTACLWSPRFARRCFASKVHESPSALVPAASHSSPNTLRDTGNTPFFSPGLLGAAVEGAAEGFACGVSASFISTSPLLPAAAAALRAIAAALRALVAVIRPSNAIARFSRTAHVMPAAPAPACSASGRSSDMPGWADLAPTSAWLCLQSAGVFTSTKSCACMLRPFCALAATLGSSRWCFHATLFTLFFHSLQNGFGKCTGQLGFCRVRAKKRSQKTQL